MVPSYIMEMFKLRNVYLRSNNSIILEVANTKLKVCDNKAALQY